MYVIGLLFYIGMVSLYYFDSIKKLVAEAVHLAPEISIVIGFITIYPLAIFLYHLVFRLRAYNYGRYLSSQAKLAASASVSFGLIGTFQGLTQMVSTISGAMSSGSGDTDLVMRMNVMIDSISSALASMSYAFITSICGVAASVLILIALNFFISYYKKAEPQTEAATTNNNSKEIGLLLAKINQVEELNLAVAKKLVGLPAIEEDSNKVITLLSEIKEGLHSTLSDISALNKNQIELQQATAAKLIEIQQSTASTLLEIQQFNIQELREIQQSNISALQEINQSNVSALGEFSRIIQESAGRNLSELNAIMSEQKQAFGLISSSLDDVNANLEQTFIYTKQLPELINKHNTVHETLQEVKNDIINGLRLLSNDVRLIPDLLHSQNTSTNTLIEVQQSFSENMRQTSVKIEELIAEQKKARLTSSKVRKSLQEALEIFADE